MFLTFSNILFKNACCLDKLVYIPFPSNRLISPVNDPENIQSLNDKIPKCYYVKI